MVSFRFSVLTVCSCCNKFLTVFQIFCRFLLLFVALSPSIFANQAKNCSKNQYLPESHYHNLTKI